MLSLAHIDYCAFKWFLFRNWVSSFKSNFYFIAELKSLNIVDINIFLNSSLQFLFHSLWCLFALLLLCYVKAMWFEVITFVFCNLISFLRIPYMSSIFTLFPILPLYPPTFLMSLPLGFMTSSSLINFATYIFTYINTQPTESIYCCSYVCMFNVNHLECCRVSSDFFY